MRNLVDILKLGKMEILIKKSKLRTEWMGLTEEQTQEKYTGILENKPKKKKKNTHNKS